jgi:hypothetical protein
MSGFLQLSQAVCRYRLKPLNALIPEERVHLLLDRTGFAVNRTGIQIARLRPVLEKIIELIPTVATSQAQILQQYNRISSLAGLFSESAREHDSFAPESLKCVPLLDDAFTSLKQFYEDLGGASKLSGPALETTCDNLTDLAKNVLQRFSKVGQRLVALEKQVAAQVTHVDLKKFSHAHSSASILLDLEHTIVDFSFLSCNDSIAASEPYRMVIQRWLSILIGYCGTVFGQTLVDLPNLLATTSTFLVEQPSLPSVLALVENVIDDPKLFADAGSHTIRLLQDIHALESNAWIVTDYTESTVQLITGVFLRKNQPQQLINALQKIIALFRHHIREGTVPEASHAEAACSAILTYFSNDPEMVSLASCSLIRAFLSTVSECGTGERILLSLSSEINRILAMLLQSIQDINRSAQEVYKNNLMLFDEGDLGEINYYAVAIENVASIQSSDAECVSTINQLSTLFGAVPNILRQMASGCPEPAVASRLNEIARRGEHLAISFYRWKGEMELCLTSTIMLRATAAYSTFSFLHANQIELPEKLKGLVGTLGTYLPFIGPFKLFDAIAVDKVLTTMKELRPEALEFHHNIKNTAATSPHVRLAHIAFPIIIREFPQLVSQLSTLQNITSHEVFICRMKSELAQAVSLMDFGLNASRKNLACLSGLLVLPFSMLLGTLETIDSSETYASTLRACAANMRPAIDAIWAIANSFHDEDKEPDLASLQQFVAALKQMLQELLSTVSKLPQPFLECEIPDALRELKAIEAMAAALPIEFQAIAAIILDILKTRVEDDASRFLKAWIGAAAGGGADITIELTCRGMLDAGIRYLNKSPDENRGSILERIAYLSVALSTPTSFGEPWDDHIAALHRQIIGWVPQILDQENGWEPLLRHVMGISETISGLQRFLPASPEERTQLLGQAIAKLLPALHGLRAHAQSPFPENVVDALIALKDLEILYSLARDGAMLAVVQGAFAQLAIGQLEEFQGVIQTFAERAMSERTSDISQVATTAAGSLVDLMYGRAGAFREAADRVLAAARTGQATVHELTNILGDLNSAAYEGAAVTLRSLSLANLTEVHGGAYVEAFAELTSALAQFVPTTLGILGAPPDSCTAELRPLSRRMVRVYDRLVTLVESPPAGQRPSDPFGQLQLSFRAGLANLTQHIGRLGWAAVKSFVPEMYNRERAQVLPGIEAARLGLRNSAEQLLAKAVGVTREDFQALVTEFESTFEQWAHTASSLDFSDPFAAAPLITELGPLAEVTQRLSALAAELTDHVIIQPDPAAAAQLPDDYSPPPPPDSTDPPPPDAAYADLLGCDRELRAALSAFRIVLGDSLAEGRVLQEAFAELKDSVDVFVGGALRMAVATRDPRLQVEQQTQIHAVADAFTGLRDALRARIMRAGDFDKEVDQGLTAFEASLAKMMTLGEAGSHVEEVAAVAAPAPVEDVEEDEVSREFKASAFAIEEMAARLKQISDQVDQSALVEETDDEAVADDAEKPRMDLQAVEGSLPAFVISHANPVLEAAALILRRAQEITNQIMRDLGKIENEKLIIRCAQELSEAAALLLIVAELLIAGNDEEASFKVVTAARIIKASVSSLVAQVLVKGGDSEGIMNEHVKTVVIHTDKIIVRAESIMQEQARAEEAKKKAAPNKMIKRLNLSTRITDIRKKLQDDEKKLYQFRKRF